MSHTIQRVVDKNGVEGIILTEIDQSGVNRSEDSERSVLVRFQDGRRFSLSKEYLTLQADGHYKLDFSIDELSEGSWSLNSQQELLELETADSLIFPIIQEQAQLHTQTVQTGTVAIHKTVQERVEEVDQPLHSEDVTIERITLNQPVTEPPSARYEGDTLIIPLLEEVLFVEKRLVLREEIHVKKLRKEFHTTQQVTLRQEQVEIERKPGSESPDQRPQNAHTSHSKDGV